MPSSGDNPHQTDPKSIDGGPLIAASGISKRYGPTVALSEVDVHLNPGEIVALAGENGSGKSTLARILSGALRPDAGQILVAGESVHFRNSRQASDLGVALVSQEPTLAPTSSVAQNVMVSRLGGRPLRRVSLWRLSEMCSPVLDRVGLEVDPRRLVGSLSQGEQELVEMAEALSTNPKVLILDEATTRVTDTSPLFRIVQRLVDDGGSVILITHRLREIRSHADRAVVLRDGEMVGKLGRDELTDERITSMMVGRELSAVLRDRSTVTHGDIALTVDELRVVGSDSPVSFHVRRGEVVGVAGLMGSGRTELLETIAGLRHAASGSVRVFGQDLDGATVAGKIAAGVALVPEDRISQGLVVNASLQRNMMMGSLRPTKRVNRIDHRLRSAELIERLGIKCSGAGSLASELSGGNQQKVVLGRALSMEPGVLLLDEPTRGIDVGARAAIYQVIQSLLNEGLAVLLASSDLIEILSVCDRVLTMFEGSIVGELSQVEATEERISILATGGQLTNVA